MSKFTINFFELAFLAEACIPPHPIARLTFWRNLTDVYWKQMTEKERVSLFNWLIKSNAFNTSLNEDIDVKIFYARFDPDNQYMVTTKDGEKYIAYKYNNNYRINSSTLINSEYIVSIDKINP